MCQQLSGWRPTVEGEIVAVSPSLSFFRATEERMMEAVPRRRLNNLRRRGVVASDGEQDEVLGELWGEGEKS